MPVVFGVPIPSYLVDIFRLCVWLAILVVIFVPLERLFTLHPQRVFRREFVVDLLYYFFNSLAPAAILSIPVGCLAWLVHNALPHDIHVYLSQLPLWARVVVGLVAGEIGYYWGHRLSHEIPFLWRFHSIHHSAQDMDFLVNTRAHPIDIVFSRFCGLVPIYILGLGGPARTEGSMVPVIVTLIGTVWGFFIHANLRWRFGPLEWLISTPAFHHWHHTLSGPINVNYASNFPWLDRLFGSHYLPSEFPTDYGIKAKVPHNLFDQLAYPIFPDPQTPAPSSVNALETSEQS